MKTIFLAPLFALTLIACGGPSGGQPSTPPGSDLFKQENAWKGELPKGAEMLSPEDFQKGVASGDLTLVSDASLAAQAAARRQQAVQDQATLQALPDKSPHVIALLAEANAAADVDGDRTAALPGGQVIVLNGLGTQLREAVEAHRQAGNPSNALANYAAGYALLPSSVQAQVPGPDTLRGRPLADVQAALGRMNASLGSMPNLDRTRLDTPGQVSAQGTLNPGNGADNNGPCAAAKGIQASFWFPLKNFLSPIKDQGARGTCWAFAAAAALDSREALQNGAVSNLSEQFLVNKVKQDWDKDNYVDGYWSEKALNLATDKGQPLLGEGGWTYNRSPKRPEYKAGDSDSYANSCDAYSGTCSDSSHQSREACTTVIFRFCAYAGVRFDGPGVRANHTIQAWESGNAFNLELYRNLLANGHALVASFTVYRGFMDDAAGGGGYVTNLHTPSGSVRFLKIIWTEIMLPSKQVLEDARS